MRKSNITPKDDIRNTFPKIWEEVLNSSNPELVNHIFGEIMDPNCVFEGHIVSQQFDGTSSDQLDFTINGVDAIAARFIACVVAVPDSLFLVHEWKSFLRPNNFCCIVLKYTFTGFKPYDYEIPCALHEENIPSSSEEDSIVDLDVSSSDGESRKTSNDYEEAPIPSVQFRELSKTIRYDNRKRGRLFTLGEFIASNQISKKLHSLEENNTTPSNGLEKFSLSSLSAEDANSVGSGSGSESPSIQTTTDLSGNQLTTRKAGQIVNLRGVLRMHINSDNRIFKLHCVRLPPTFS